MTDSERIVQLETRVALLEAEREHLTTKADLAQAVNALTWRFVTALIAVVIIMITAIRLMA